MIIVTKLDGSEVVVNADLIVCIEKTPDTVITLNTGAKVMVKEEPEELVDRVVMFRRRISQGPVVLPRTEE